MPALLAVLAIALPPAPAVAVEVQAVDQTTTMERERLFESLKNASTEAVGRAIENAFWEMWMAQAPTPEIARSVKQAMDARESYDYDRALSLLDAAIAAAPAYAEAWNQRAFIRFLKEDLDGALADIERTLTLEPRHFAALSGRALTLMRQGRMELAQQALREAVAIHPWLKERAMLIPEPGENPPAPDGRDI
jgi:tetratricopeptide (TPR) repeat protein